MNLPQVLDWLALLCDFNIASEDRGVYDPAAWKDNALVSEPKRQAFRTLLQIGLYDSFRLFDSPGAAHNPVGLPHDGVPAQPGLAHRPHPRQRRA